MNNPYRVLGLILCAIGAIFAPVSYFILDSTPLTAFGLSTIVIGFVCVALANTRPYVSPEACQLMLQTGMENISSLLEELGIINKAIYLPSSMRDGHAQALIPLVKEADLQLIKGKIPGRLIIRYGANPEAMAIAVTTPGSINMGMLETKPGPSSAEIEAASAYILTGVLDIASSVKIHLADSRIEAEVKGPKLQYEDIWYYRCLGSPIASIIATISSEALGKPVRVADESFDKKKTRIVLEILP